MIGEHVKPGISTERLNTICHEFILDHNAIPSPLNYRGFPKSICTSVNQQVCHGIPGDRILRGGDIINIDITTNLDGFHGDTSRTFYVGKPGPKALKVTEVAEDCLLLGIQAVKPGGHISDIGNVIEPYARKNRCTVVREAFHEEPAVLHYTRRQQGELIKPGMIFTVEPMINLGKAAIKHLPDKWTVVTKDHSLSAQFEHTLLVTETGYDVLTLLDEDRPSFEERMDRLMRI